VIRRFFAEFRIYNISTTKDPTHVPAPPSRCRGMRAARRDEAGDSLGGLARPLLPLNHQRLMQAVDSLGRRVAPRWFYRQMYRHLEWDPLAQLSSSVDIYREQSARPRWPAFEIYRHPSSPRTVGDCIDTRSSRSGTRLRRAGIKRHRLLSRLTFQPAFLPSGASIKARSDVSIEA
jgi:hypothetical protein